MKTQYFTSDTTTNKLILLFVMEKMGIPLTEGSIIDICYNNNSWINYMDCKEVLYSLINSNFIYRASGNGNDSESSFTITYEGRNCLSNFYYKIPLSLREAITEYAKENKMHFKRSQEYVSNYFKNKDGSYSCVFKIKDVTVGDPVFEVHIKAPNRQAAIDACRLWREKAHIAYENIYELFIDSE